MISSSIKFLLNDKILEIKNPDPNQTILNYIRTELKKTGTKEGCSEGGCGACTIVLGELVKNEIKCVFYAQTYIYIYIRYFFVLRCLNYPRIG